MRQKLLSRALSSIRSAYATWVIAEASPPLCENEYLSLQVPETLRMYDITRGVHPTVDCKFVLD